MDNLNKITGIVKGTNMVASNSLTDDEKFLYLLMYAPGNTLEFNESLPGGTWLQKQIFLLKTTIPEIKLKFDKNRFGAYCSDLNDMLARGLKSGKIIQPNDGHGPLWLSEKGQEMCKYLWEDADESTRTDISDLKKFMNDMSYDELIAHSYSTFPKTTANSDILKRFEGIRVSAACSLFAKKKVTLEKASMIAGLLRSDFISILEDRVIPAHTATIDGFRRSLKELECIA